MNNFSKLTISRQSKTKPVHKVSGKREGGPRVTCHRCGKPGHLATVCRHRESVWDIWRKYDQPALPGKPKKDTLRQIHQSDDGSDEKTVEQRQKGRTPPIKVQVVVDKVSKLIQVPGLP